MLPLNSYDEWSPLREVILGTGINYTSHDRELSFELFYHDNIIRSEWYYPRLSPGSGHSTPERLAINQRYVEELNEDINGIAETLESLGVTVHRPMNVDSSTNLVRTLAWEASMASPPNVRDIALIAGDEIIETPPMVRSRYFETQLLKPVFQEYFRGGARRTAMPRPLMTDASFDLSYVGTMGGPTEPIENPQPSAYDAGFEMMFDGTRCMRLGRDIVANVSTANHALAVDWLERHLEGRLRIHRVYRLSDSHIDSMVLALRPGTLLVRSEAVAEQLPEPLRRWDKIVAPPPEENNFPTYGEGDLVLSSVFIDLNVFSVSPDTVLVNQPYPELMKLLEKNRFTVVPVRHRHRRLFGGGFHCQTLDTVREGGPEDYLS
jgi:glycine amidinotransferase